ncbi:MFS transporter [Jiangella aurantiaca]|uniref:MFS transporter n=1 Tax=Jiangella aurantiaca TaxID=2530373 RepID=A0A4R5A794_9ACTN|nr:MFS transporter [Jiangella aurantiaca]TDD67861.1 MFS transporter [Jiangella aurantiaca]
MLPVVILCVAELVNVLGVTVVVPALPAIERGLDTSGELVVTGYAATFGGLLILAGRLGDRLGHRRLLLAGLTVFGTASAAAGLAPSAEWLVAARCLQGAGAAAMIPNALSLLVAHAGDRHGRAVALWTAVGAVGGGSGFFVGGVLTDVAGWRWILLVNVPVTVVLAAGVATVVRPAPRHDGGGLDVAGGVTVTAALVVLVLTASASGPAAVAGVAATGLLLAAFVVVERRAEDPILPPRTWSDRRLSSASAVALVNNAATGSAVVVGAGFAQRELALTPSAAGLVLLSFNAAVIAGSALAPRLSGGRPDRAMRIGLAVMAAAALALATGTATVTGTTGTGALAAGLALLGAGLGVSAVGSTTLGTAGREDRRGTSSALINTGAQVGTAVGVAVVLGLAGTDGHRPGWLLAAAIAVAGLAAVIRPIRPEPPQPATSPATPYQRAGDAA